MVSKDCKRLAEVDFPIAEVSKHAAREKSIRHGHPSTLHLWWARRPLASSRAVLMALLLPDPCDEHCPEAFKKKARRLLLRVANCDPGTTDETLRKALLRFIGDFANWNLAANRTYLDVSRAIVKAAHGEDTPLVVDPFAGGGSIPLEALRLGCEAFASDLNPVACLILKVMLEDIPRHGPGLAEAGRVDLFDGAHVLVHGHSDPLRQFPRHLDRESPVQRLVKFSLGCGRDVLLAVLFFFFESRFLPLLVVSTPHEVRISLRVRPQMIQTGSNSGQSAYRASPRKLSGPFSDRESSATPILPES